MDKALVAAIAGKGRLRQRRENLPQPRTNINRGSFFAGPPSMAGPVSFVGTESTGASGSLTADFDNSVTVSVAGTRLKRQLSGRSIFSTHRLDNRNREDSKSCIPRIGLRAVIQFTPISIGVVDSLQIGNHFFAFRSGSHFPLAVKEPLPIARKFKGKRFRCTSAFGNQIAPDRFGRHSRF